MPQIVLISLRRERPGCFILMPPNTPALQPELVESLVNLQAVFAKADI